jgi:hypothetical protein
VPPVFCYTASPASSTRTKLEYHNKLAVQQFCCTASPASSTTKSCTTKHAGTIKRNTKNKGLHRVSCACASCVLQVLSPSSSITKPLQCNKHFVPQSTCSATILLYCKSCVHKALAVQQNTGGTVVGGMGASCVFFFLQVLSTCCMHVCACVCVYVCLCVCMCVLSVHTCQNGILCPGVPSPCSPSLPPSLPLSPSLSLPFLGLSPSHTP